MRKNFHMKKVVMLAVAMVLAAAPVVLAESYTIYDLQDVRTYKGSSPVSYYSSDWVDVIGPTGDESGNGTGIGFNTRKVVLTFTNPGNYYSQDLKIDLYTNYISGLNGSVPADVILSLGDTNNYAIAMSNHGGTLIQGALYQVDQLQSSIDRWSSGGIYGGAWDDSLGSDPGNTAWTYMTGNPTKVLNATNFSWGTGADGSKYIVSISYAGYNADQLPGLNNITGYWGTGDCSNDGISFTYAGTPVPLPPTALLLGSGLLGLALLGKRQIRKSE